MKNRHIAEGLIFIKRHVIKAWFTIIELLVVIAIIAILMTILLPALKKAKEKGKEISCISNLKQLGGVLHMYAGDYDNWPPAYCMPQGNSRFHYWPNQLAPYFGVAIVKGETYSGTPLECPAGPYAAFRSNDADGTNYSFFYFNYGLSYRKTESSSPNTYWRKMNDTKRPTETMFGGDTRCNPKTGYSYILSGIILYPYDDITEEGNPDPRHSGNGVNFVYFDGHASRINYRDIPILGGYSSEYAPGCKNYKHNFWDWDYDGINN